MCSLLCKALRIVKYQRNMALQKEDSKPPQTGPKEMESQEVPGKEFKIIILMMHRELQEIWINNLNISGKQYKNKMKSATKTENIKKNQIEILVLKNVMTELQNSIRSFSSRLDQTEKRIRA